MGTRGFLVFIPLPPFLCHFGSRGAKELQQDGKFAAKLDRDSPIARRCGAGEAGQSRAPPVFRDALNIRGRARSVSARMPVRFRS